MRVNNNIASLNIQNSMGKVQTRADSSMRKLSTGLRINSAADDAAGMAISNKLKTQVNGLKMASRNSLDGISLVQTAEGALNEVQSMIQRMRQLAIQGANDTLQSEDRAAIQLEVDQLLIEIDDTAIKTEFNKKKLLNGDSDRATASSNSDVVTTSFTSATIDSGRITYDLVGAGTPANITSPSSLAPGAVTLNTVAPSASLEGKLNINGEVIEITATDKPIDIANKLKELCDRVGVDINITGIDGSGNQKTWEDWINGTATMLLTTQKAGSDQSITISSNNTTLLKTLSLPNNADTPVYGTDAKIVNVQYDGVAVLASAKGNEISITANAGQTVRLDVHTKIDTSTEGGTFRLGDGTPVSFDPANQGITPPPARQNVSIAIGASEDIVMGLDFPTTEPMSITIKGGINDGKNLTIPANTANVAAAVAQLNSDLGDTSGGLFKATAGILQFENKDVTSGGSITITVPKQPTIVAAGGTENVIPVADFPLLSSHTITIRGGDNDKSEVTLPKGTTETAALLMLNAGLIDDTKGEFKITAGQIVFENKDSVPVGIKADAGKLDRLSMDLLDFGPLVIHVGPNRGISLNVQLPNLSAEGLGIGNINMLSRLGCDAAIGALDEALSRVSDIRARLGAYQNRLEYTISNLDTTHENATSSLSRIEDADMAIEMSEFTKQNVLSQAGISVLSQANMRPQQILSLLQ